LGGGKDAAKDERTRGVGFSLQRRVAGHPKHVHHSNFKPTSRQNAKTWGKHPMTSAEKRKESRRHSKGTTEAITGKNAFTGEQMAIKASF